MDFSFIREDFDINSIAKSMLSIQINPDGFSFVICPVNSIQNPDYIYIKTIDNPETENLKDALLSFNGFDLKEFYSIRIMFPESTFALVPESIFDLQDMKAYLKLTHPPQAHKKPLSHMVAGVGAICVFSIDESLFKLLRKKFPGSDFCHTFLPLCTYALSTRQDGCFIQIYKNMMELLMIKDQKLLLYNIFELQNENDIAYFTLNAYKTSQMDLISNPLCIAGFLTENSEAINISGRYIKNIRYYSADDINKAQFGSLNYPLNYFLNHREILNCEL